MADDTFDLDSPRDDVSEPLARPKSFTWRKAIPIYIALWCEAFNSSSIFSYMGFMILDFNLSKDEKDSSYMYGMAPRPTRSARATQNRFLLLLSRFCALGFIPTAFYPLHSHYSGH